MAARRQAALQHGLRQVEERRRQLLVAERGPRLRVKESAGLCRGGGERRAGELLQVGVQCGGARAQEVALDGGAG